MSIPNTTLPASNKPLGCHRRKGSTHFAIYAPRALSVTLVLFDRPEDEAGFEIELQQEKDGVWSHTVHRDLLGWYYGYKVDNPKNPTAKELVIPDPYSRALTSRNHWRYPAKTVIIDTSFDWSDDTFTPPESPAEWIIYEAHLKDLTAHPSSGVKAPGTYLGAVEHAKPGGLSHLSTLGVNAIEFLPLHAFGYFEPPYDAEETEQEIGIRNTWNRYARNHWGYMTRGFFAPEPLYGSDASSAPDLWVGRDGRAVTELKSMIKELHKHGIAVIIDVVYNHTSNYDHNPLRIVDAEYYYHLEWDGSFRSHSGCGNDFRTESPMARRLIIDSVMMWLQEYNVDGFRFDLAAMIDWETCVQITRRVKEVKPAALLIAEPWGGSAYSPEQFSAIGWSCWNDKFRNSIKGENPFTAPGFTLGAWFGGDSQKNVRSCLCGSTKESGGIFRSHTHSVNYVEAHDGFTLGDFLRLATRETDPAVPVETDSIRLSEQQMRVAKLTALCLMVSQGVVMIHQGQEYGRSKKIAPNACNDPLTGTFDENSYNKDNETNWINYRHIADNAELFEYYRGLVQLRKSTPNIFGNAKRSQIFFLETGDPFLVGFTIEEVRNKKTHRWFVALNAERFAAKKITLPKGRWELLVNENVASAHAPLLTLQDEFLIPHSSGIVCRQITG